MKRFFITPMLLILLIFFSGIAQQKKKIKAPDFKLATYDKKIVQLSKLKGKIVLINFWATWCPPCRAEIPDFIEVYKKYKSRGFEIIGIALDDDGWSKVKPFITTNKISYPVVLGTPNIVQKYGNINSIPTTFVVDKKGYFIAYHSGVLSKSALEQFLESVLK